MLFSIDGNIGAGKSTLLKNLENTVFCKDHVVFYEPVDEWMSIRPEGPGTKSLFEKFYSDKARYGFMFQMYALQTRLNHLLDIIAKNPDKIIICERTHHTDAEIFAKMLAKKEIMDKSEYFVYEQWYQYCQSTLHDVVKGFIYLRTSVPTCMNRIVCRNRTGEENIDQSYIQTLHDLHEEWFARNKCPVCIIDGNQPKDSVDINSIVEFINSFYKS